MQWAYLLELCMLLDLLTMCHTAGSSVCFCCSISMALIMYFPTNLWFSGSCHLRFGPMRMCSPFSTGLWVVPCGDLGVAQKFAGSWLHLEKIVAPVWFGVLAFQLYLGSYLDLANSLLAEKTPPKKVTESCFIAHFVLLNDQTFLLGYVEQVYQVCVMIFVILTVYEDVVMNCKYSWALCYDVIHLHLKYVLTHF